MKACHREVHCITAHSLAGKGRSLCNSINSAADGITAVAQLEHIEAIEKRLWGAADMLRANSNYASNEYFLPVMGLIFLRHAYSRYLGVKDAIAATLPTRGGKTRPLAKEDFPQKGAIFLRPEAQFDSLGKDACALQATDWPPPFRARTRQCERRGCAALQSGQCAVAQVQRPHRRRLPSNCMSLSF
jgi:hypothetical protein